MVAQAALPVTISASFSIPGFYCLFYGDRIDLMRAFSQALTIFVMISIAGRGQADIDF